VSAGPTSCAFCSPDRAVRWTPLCCKVTARPAISANSAWCAIACASKSWLIALADEPAIAEVPPFPPRRVRR
jgi:hypothetical protein